MWHLTRIHASNLCSFHNLEYSPKQGEATLIFGNNLDSDSQNSNGSGKSALIEAIAIALTGDPLRKVNTDEIINDSKDEAIVTAVLSNDEQNAVLTINRRLSRKQPQQIQILRQDGPYDTDTEEVAQATVADYNKYILDQLGLTRDDIFANFILTARKYKSFLSSSDKEKKEIINRFSNGAMVDKSIEELKADMEPVQDELSKAESTVALYTGKVEALATEIEKAVNEAADRKASNEARIEEWKRLISDKRKEIRKAKEGIEEISERFDNLDELDEAMQDLEQSDAETLEALDRLTDLLKANNLSLDTDYKEEIREMNNDLAQAQQTLAETSDAASKLQKAFEEAEDNLRKLTEDSKKDKASIETRKAICQQTISTLMSTAKGIQADIDKVSQRQASARKNIARLEQQLAGVIQCPKCKHEFSFDLEMDVTETRNSLEDLNKTLSSLADKAQEYEKRYADTVAEGRKERENERKLEEEESALSRTLNECDSQMTTALRRYNHSKTRIGDAENELRSIQKKIGMTRKNMFDEAFAILEDTYKVLEARTKSLETDIDTAKGSIDSYEKAIAEACRVSEEEIIQSLKRSRKEYSSELAKATDKKAEVEAYLNELKAQEATFTEFKTYLANTKINAISQITNEFLETIGSDIRVSLSGYTILRSGKVRDKISVTLLRDGMDCGSFEKFSAGERVRVELASILSMNKLTNLNCDEGKGLDLLIADEVLDSADEQGLASVFKALNKTQVTSLVVSHGNVAESYPNRILVTKSNGISFIDENTKPQ